jgi:phosphonate transport system substrate-binding protein
MKKKSWFRLPSRLTACLLFSFLLAGCQEQSPSTAAVSEPPEVQKLRIGILPEYDLFSQKKRYDPLALYLSRRTGVEIELKMLSRYGNILDNFKAEQLEGAFLGSFTGALAIKKLAVEPLARPELEDGTSTYFGMVFVRRDSGIENAADMKGKRFVFVDKATTAGWLLPHFFFHEIGIKNYCAWFSEWYFAGTHENAIADVLNGRADIGAAKNTVFDRLANHDERIRSELKILVTSPRVSENALVIMRSVDESLRQNLKKALLGMEQDEEGRRVLRNFEAARFIETGVEDYAPVFQYAAQIGLDLDTYDYINE